MNREIKFRAWHKNLCKMLEPKEWHHYGPKIISGVLSSEDHEIMQLTGKLTRSKQEVYVGDIVKVRGMKTVGEYVDVIVEDDQGFTLKYNKTYFKSNICFVAILEVIGNIYENPELLSNG